MLQINTTPQRLDMIKAEIEKLNIEKNSIELSKANIREIARIDVRLDMARKEFTRIESVWKQGQELHSSIARLEKHHEELEAMYETAKTNEDFQFAATLVNSEIPKVRKDLDEVSNELARLQDNFSFLGIQKIFEMFITQWIVNWLFVDIF